MIDDIRRIISRVTRKAGVGALLIVCIFLTIVKAAGVAEGKVIYVNFTDGNEENGDGSSGTPYKTIARALNDVPSEPFTQEYIIEVTDSGTSILSEQITVADKGGNKDHGLTIKATSGATIDINGSRNGFYITTPYVTIDGFKIRGLVPDATNPLAAIRLDGGANYCKIKNNDIKGAGMGNHSTGDYGILGYAENGDITDCEITNNTVYDFQQEKISGQLFTTGIVLTAINRVVGGNCIIRGNTVRNCKQGIQLYGISSAGTFHVEENRVYWDTDWNNPAGVGIYGIIVSTPGSTTRHKIYISKNSLTHLWPDLGHSSRWPAGILLRDVKGDPCLISNNFISDCSVGIDTYSGSASLDIKVYNNTIKDCSGFGIYIDPLCTGWDIKSNIISLSDFSAYAIYVEEGAHKDFNSNYNDIHCANPAPMYWRGSDEKLSKWQKHDDGDSITDDPQLEKDPPYHLRAGSKCIDRWDSDPTDGLVTEDIDSDKRPRNRAYDIGADEAGSYPVEPKGKQLATLGGLKRTVLYQNYPNPFNPETWIPFSLSESEHVTIKIYNSTGQLVRTLNLGRKDAGDCLNKEKAAYWNGKNSDGEDVASGVYFYVMEASSFRATKKMVILR